MNCILCYILAWGKNPRVEKLGGFSIHGGMSSLPTKQRFESDPEFPDESYCVS